MKKHTKHTIAALVAGLFSLHVYAATYQVRVPIANLVVSEAPLSAELNVSPASLSFNATTVGNSAWQIITLTNPGATAAPIGTVLAQGPFEVDNRCPSVLGAGASCELSVRTTPVESNNVVGSIVLQSAGLSLELQGSLVVGGW